MRKTIHRVVDHVGRDIEGLRFNRAVAQIYELTNVLVKHAHELQQSPSATGIAVLRDGALRLVQMIAPMMPHLAEACWEALGGEGLAADAPWPAVDPTLLVDDTVTMPVQVNGKRRGEVVVAKGSPNATVEKEALSLDAVARMLDGRPPKKVVIVPDRIVNVVV